MPRKLIIFTAILLLLSGSSYAFGRSGNDFGRIITESRCRSGAFLAHTDDKTTAESDEDLANTPVGGLLTTPAASATTLTGPNLFANGNFETLDPQGHFDAWITIADGGTKANFQPVSGHNSPTAARVDVSNYEPYHPAEYYMPAVKVTAGGYYQFHDYYRSNVATRAVLMTIDASGKRSYTNLTDAAASSSWDSYTVTFFMPQSAVQATVFHSIVGKGSLEVDDVSFTEAQPKGFHRPLVTLTFDDGWRSIHDNALPLLKRYNLVSTQYIISGYVGQAKDYMTPGDVFDMRDSGNEIGSHTVNHADLSHESAGVVNNELSTSKANLDKCFTNVTNFASPYGTYSVDSVNTARRLYTTYRSTDTGYNTADGFSPYALKVQNVDRNTTQDQIKTWLQTAAKNNVWLILVYHQVDETDSFYARKPALLDRDLQTIKASGLTVKTMAAAYAEIQPQLSK